MPFCNFSTMIYTFVQGNLYPCVCSSEACFPFVSLYCRSGKWEFAGGGEGLAVPPFSLKIRLVFIPSEYSILPCVSCQVKTTWNWMLHSPRYIRRPYWNNHTTLSFSYKMIDPCDMHWTSPGLCLIGFKCNVHWGHAVCLSYPANQFII